jgi:prepilin-type N-terminal cleavage/methylation domain-containing protein
MTTKQYRNQSNTQAGFTIIELLIATAVFSVILLLSTTGLIQIGRMYYKGITAAQTQEAARMVMDDISRTIQFKGGTVIPTGPAATQNRFCIGGKRYSFLIDLVLSDNPALPSERRNVLVSDDFGGTCDAQDLDSGAALTDTSRELLRPNMRLAKLEVVNIPDSDLFQITVRVVHGDIDLSPGGTCEGGPGSQFCAASELSTVVKKRVE